MQMIVQCENVCQSVATVAITTWLIGKLADFAVVALGNVGKTLMVLMGIGTKDIPVASAFINGMELILMSTGGNVFILIIKAIVTD